MRLLAIILYIALLKSSKGSENSEIIILISDFIVKLKNPIKINAYVCWTTDDQLLLWKQLFSNNFGCQIGKITNNLTYSFPREHQLFLVDLNCKSTDTFLKKASDINLFNEQFRWIFWGKNDWSIFKDYYLRLDSRVFVIEKNNNKYKIKSLYKLAENQLEFLENDLAVWEKNKGFLVYNELCLSRNRTNLMGLNLNISYVITNNDSLNHLEDYRNKHIDPISKLNWVLMKHLVTYLNASFTPILQSSWGYREINDSSKKFNGMIGDLQSGVAEFGGTALFFTLDRFNAIEYVAPNVPTPMKFIFRAPPLSYVSNVFTLPFDTYVWYSCFTLVLIIFIVVYIIVHWEWADPIFNKKIDDMFSNCVSPLRPRFFDVMMMEFGAIAQQGTDVEPKSNSGRIATVFTFIAFMFLYTAYSANIVAILQSTTESINNLEDLLNSRISLGVEDIVYARYFFKVADGPVRKAIYQQKIAPKGQKANFMTMQEGISRVKNDFFAFHVEASNGYKVVADTFQENEKCSLREIEYLNLIHPWLSIRKKSAYKKIVKVGLRKIFESGIQRREINRLYIKKPICLSKGCNFGSAGFMDCYAAFLLYGVGILFSFIILFFELLLKRKINRNETNKSLTIGIK